ncbi:hypothetical protein ACP70R_029880 [Stipagrostis hirtigluma subsp. patula]
MASNPWTFTQNGVEAMNSNHFMVGGGGMMGADVPPFHPSMLLDHGGFGLGDAAMTPELGAQFAANNLMLASFANQLFHAASVPRQDDHFSARPPPEEEMAGGFCGAGQSGAMVVWPSSSASHHLPDVAGFHYPLTACAGGANAAAASELSLTLSSKSSSASGQCSPGASRSALTEVPQVSYPQAPAHFAAVVARSRYAAVAQEVLNQVVGHLLDGVAEVAADSCSGAASAVSSNKLLASSGDGGARRGNAKRVRSDLLKMLQLMDQKYNQCLDEMQSTVAKFNTLMQPGGVAHGSICAPFAHRAVAAMYRGLRRRIAGEIMAAAGTPTCLGESSSSVTASEMESAFRQKQLLRRREQQCWKPRRGLPEDSVAVLKAWMFEHFLKPYPDDHEKDVLAARTGLNRSKVTNWFINARVRLWKPLIEELYQEIKRSSGGGQGSAMEQCRQLDGGQ